MRPAAQLARESIDLDHSHQVGVLLPKEHHRAEVTCLLERGGKVPDRLVLRYLLQRELLDALDLIICDPPCVAVVEAQPVRPDVAARLHDLLAKDCPQCPVQDVRGRVVCLDLLPAHPVNGGSYRIPNLERAAFDPCPEHLIVTRRDGIEDLELSVLRGDPTPVRHLPATGGVERVIGQYDVHLSPSVGHGLDGDYSCLYLLALVADKAAPDLLVPERSNDPLVAPRGLPGTLPLCVHRSLETRLIERQTPLDKHLTRHLHRETVRVVQHEGHVAREVPAPHPLYLGSKKRHPRLVDLDEPSSLAGDDAAYVLTRRP